MWLEKYIEKNIIPDPLLRQGIRKLLKQRLRDEKKASAEKQQEALSALIAKLKTSPIAVHTEAANQQHYEVPTAFYSCCLGKHMKYSSAYWHPGVTELDRAESDMLELTCTRAALEDGQHVLELGCGWGSLSLYMAAKYPNSRFTVVSNSRTQKLYIDEQIKNKGLTNLHVLTADINHFGPRDNDGTTNRDDSDAGHQIHAAAGSFDRVVSVEMFEHMRNYRQLFKKVAAFLKPDGKLFVHIFSHKTYTYLFEVKDESDWMSRYFFTGGIMPGNHLFLYFNEDMVVEKQWEVDGTHYGKTAEAWLKNMDLHKHQILPLFDQTYGKDQAIKWWVRWRLFYMACAELFNYNKGSEWMVSHYLFHRCVKTPA